MRTTPIRVSAIGLVLVLACQLPPLGETEGHKCRMAGRLWNDKEETCTSWNPCAADSDCPRAHRCEKEECQPIEEDKPYCREDFDCRLEHGDDAGCCRSHTCVYCSKQ